MISTLKDLQSNTENTCIYTNSFYTRLDVISGMYNIKLYRNSYRGEITVDHGLANCGPRATSSCGLFLNVPQAKGSYTF